jgi:5'-nucleotidase
MGKKKNILVVNDDGIDAAGVHKLAEALSEAGDVYICSPHIQQSASGHGITIGRLVYIEDVSFAEAVHAISMEGTPADCVKIGIEIYRDRGIDIDMVFSGFNHGMNLGTDTLYSGTVSAAVEGGICGLPSAAMSISSNLAYHRVPDNFEAGMALAQKLARSDMFQNRDAENPKTKELGFIQETHVILNVNIPDLPAEKIKGVKVCPLSYRAYDEWFLEKEDGAGRNGYHYSGYPQIIGDADADESDIIANRMGYATITPLQFDLTDHRLVEKIRAAYGA